MKREPRLFLQDILEAAQLIRQFVAGFDYLQFQNDDKTTSAVIRKLEIIGEATKQIPDAIKIKYPDFRWREIASMRDRLIHGYFGVDYSLIWDTAQTDIPKLITQISRVLNELNQETQEPDSN